jgi:hypothetical protein
MNRKLFVYLILVVVYQLQVAQCAVRQPAANDNSVDMQKSSKLIKKEQYDVIQNALNSLSPDQIPESFKVPKDKYFFVTFFILIVIDNDLDGL